MEKTFRSRSICLIDLGSSLIVLTEGSDGGAGPDYTKGLFRLEVDRDAVVFADDKTQKKSKEECKGILDRALAPYEECQIHKVSFPFFGQDELTVVKTRPCLCLYSNNPNVPSIYLALFAGSPQAATPAGPWEMFLAGGDEGDLVPAESPTHLLDLSKMCTLPELHMLDENEFLNGKPTYDYWKITKHKIMQVEKPSDLRRQVVRQLQTVLLQDPFLEYKDNTRELDVGTWVVRYEVLRGEDVMRHMIYK